MTYELAKELRDAGFPQRPMPQFDAEGFIHRTPEEERDWVYEPDLSELIEACGLVNLVLTQGSDGKTWFSKYEFWGDNPEGTRSFSTQGSTLKEAVTRLYIALQVSPSL